MKTQNRECIHCGETFELTPNKPGKINECPDCAKEVQVYYAEQTTTDEYGDVVDFGVNKRRFGKTTRLVPASKKIKEPDYIEYDDNDDDTNEPD